MRVEAGSVTVEGSDGTVLYVDRPLSRSQVDVLLAAVAKAGLTPKYVRAVEIDEGRTVIDWLHLPAGGGMASRQRTIYLGNYRP